MGRSVRVILNLTLLLLFHKLHSTMASIVPYGSLVLSKRKYDALAYAAPYIRKYGPKMARWAARRIQKAYRAKSYKRRRIGERIGKSVAKTAIDRVDSTTLFSPNTRTLYAYDMTSIPQTSSNSIDQRQRDIINMRGFKVCLLIRNRTAQPMTFNMAVISPKGDQTGLSTGDTGSTLVLNFFRGNGNTREVDFGSAITNNQYHCLPINTDRWVVLAHQRRILRNQTNTGNYTNETPNYFKIQKYFKINRQIRYDNVGSSTSPVYFVYWIDLFMALSTGVAAAQAVDFQREFVTYFREPKT